MYENILVPLDGSPAAEQAIPWALGVARRDRSALRLVRVHLSPTPLMVGMELVSDSSLDGAIRDRERSYLEARVEAIRSAGHRDVTGEVLDGAIADALVQAAQDRKTDLVVMTTHGRGALARFWLGGVADNLIRHLSIPILLVRPEDNVPAFTTTPSIQHILIPLDGSPLAEQIIEPATQLGQVAGAAYTLITILDAVDDIVALAGQHALDIPDHWKGDYVRGKAEEYLQVVAERLKGRSFKVRTEVVAAHGSAAGTILEYAAGHGNAVIALATRGAGGLRRLVFGSVADKIIRGATMPVLIYHPGEA